MKKTSLWVISLNFSIIEKVIPTMTRGTIYNKLLKRLWTYPAIHVQWADVTVPVFLSAKIQHSCGASVTLLVIKKVWAGLHCINYRHPDFCMPLVYPVCMCQECWLNNYKYLHIPPWATVQQNPPTHLVKKGLSHGIQILRVFAGIWFILHCLNSLFEVASL